MFKTPILVVMGFDQRLEYARKRLKELDNEEQQMSAKKYQILAIDFANRTTEEQKLIDTFKKEFAVKANLELSWQCYLSEQEDNPEEEVDWPNDEQIEAKFRACRKD